MISLSIFIVGLLITIGIIISKRKEFIQEDGYGNTIFVIKPIIGAIVIFFLTLILAIFQPYSTERIDQGFVGIKVNLTGHARGASDIQYKTGWVIYNVWTEDIFEFPVYQQHIEYADQQVIVKGGFPTTIKPTFNYKLKESMVVNMFKELRRPIKEIEQGWLMNAVIGSVNDVTNRWEVDKIFNKREQFELEITAECNKRVSKWFDVSNLRTNITPPPSLQKAIEDKTRAIQIAQAKEQEALVAIANGKKLVAEAQADSAQRVTTAAGKAKALIIEASAEAEAIRLKQKEINSNYINYIRAKSWNGQYPNIMTGSGTSLLLDTREK